MRSLVGVVLDRPRNARPPDPATATPVPLAGRTAIRTPWNSTSRGAERHLAVYGENGTVFSTVGLYAQATALAQWHLYRQTTTDARLEDRPEVTSHLALQLWERPNAFMTGAFLRELLQIHLELTGTGWIVVGYTGTVPTSLWPVLPHRIVPVPDPINFIAGYVYTSPDGQQVPLRRQDVLWLRMPNPRDLYDGQGPVPTLTPHLDGARYASQWNTNFFLNSAEPGGIIAVDRRLSDDEFNEMTSRWREQHQGVAQAHRVAVLEQATYTPSGTVQRDMQFVEGMQLSDTMLRQTLRIHGHMLGLTEDVNRANAEAAEYTFAKWGTELRLSRWRELANVQYLPLFGSTGKGVEFGYDTTIPRDEVTAAATFAQRANAAVALVDAGYDSSAVLAAAELPDMKWTKPEQPPKPPMPPQLPEGDGPQARFGGWRPRA